MVSLHLHTQMLCTAAYMFHSVTALCLAELVFICAGDEQQLLQLLNSLLFSGPGRVVEILREGFLQMTTTLPGYADPIKAMHVPAVLNGCWTCCSIDSSELVLLAAGCEQVNLQRDVSIE